MAQKKSLKDAAQAGTSVFDTIAAGGTMYAQDVQDVLNAQEAPDAQDAQSVQRAPGAARPGRPRKNGPDMERLSLKIPTEIKEYLQAAAYRESSPKHMVSLTEYLVDLVRRDMELHKDD